MDYLKAFIIGGLLCVIGQILIDKTKLTPARILVSYVVIDKGNAPLENKQTLSEKEYRAYYEKYGGAVVSVSINKYMHLMMHEYFDSDKFIIREKNFILS